MILIILSISSYEMNKVIHFPALTSLSPASLPTIFLSKLSNTNEVALVAKCGKISLAKETANFNSASLPNLPY